MKLALLAIFRNESHIMEEWIRHYVKQGVDHFYLINNASEDVYQPILSKYTDKITLFHEPRVYNQKVMSHKDEVQFYNYNKVAKPAILKDNPDWVIVCDLDEFIYARKNYETIKDFLLDKGSTFDQILIREKTFTSNDFIDQPKNVVSSFTERLDYGVNHKCVPKYIVRLSSVRLFHIHYGVLKDRSITTEDNLKETTDGLIVSNRKTLIPIRNRMIEYIDESIIDDAYLACNHYHIQSKNWYFSIKATRGVAALGHDDGDVMADKWKHLWDDYDKKAKRQDFELAERQ